MNNTFGFSVLNMKRTDFIHPLNKSPKLIQVKTKEKQS